MVNITGTYKLKKTAKKRATPLLPGDALLLKQLESETAKRRQARHAEKLENIGTSVPSWQQSTPKNLADLLDAILDRMWAPIPEKLRDKDKLKQDRDVPPIVMVSHLYGIYAHNTTLVDRTLAASSGVHVYSVNIPGINEMVIQCKHFEHPLGKDPSSLVPLDVPNAASLVSQGLITKDPQRGGYSMAIPRQGAVIRLVLAGRKWLEKTLRAQKWNELPEPRLEEKLERSTGYWKDLKGVSLEWILYDAVGTGLVEPFNTPIGRGWKLAR